MTLRMHVKYLDNGHAVALLTLDTAAGWLINGASISTPSWSSSNSAIQVSPANDGLSAVLATNSATANSVVVTAGPVTVTEANGTTTLLARVQSEPLEVVSGGRVVFRF